jgi:protein SCO1/2
MLVTLLSSCSNDFPIEHDFSKDSYQLLTQDSIEVFFPELAKGKVSVIGYIFTNCPDICPLTTNNMRLVQEQLKEDKVDGIEFLALSFDPEVDKPSVLKRYAELRNLDLSNFTFLTGEKPIIDDLIKKAGVFAVPGDTSIAPNGDETIFYIHTDRISIIDEEGRVRKNYFGSKDVVDEIVHDIKQLK